MLTDTECRCCREISQVRVTYVIAYLVLMSMHHKTLATAVLVVIVNVLCIRILIFGDAWCQLLLF